MNHDSWMNKLNFQFAIFAFSSPPNNNLPLSSPDQPSPRGPIDESSGRNEGRCAAQFIHSPADPEPNRFRHSPGDSMSRNMRAFLLYGCSVKITTRHHGTDPSTIAVTVAIAIPWPCRLNCPELLMERLTGRRRRPRNKRHGGKPTEINSCDNYTFWMIWCMCGESWPVQSPDDEQRGALDGLSPYWTGPEEGHRV